MFGHLAFEKIINNYEFSTVLDIGCGKGDHTKLFEQYNKKVTSINLSKVKGLDVIIGDYNNIKFKKPFDCIWACHVLEHQFNIKSFLEKIHQDLREEGILCITVPPLKHAIVGGHYSLWNAGLLIYNLIIAGFDCKNIKIKKYGYNISIILPKKTAILPNNLPKDKGEIELINNFAPDFFKHNFNGNISEYNWE